MKNVNYLNIIKNNFNQEIIYYKFINDSYANTVIEINKEWIFRFSKEARDIKQLEIEQEFLPKFIERSPIPIPNIKYQGKNFIGYKKLMGEPLDDKIYLNLSEEKRVNILSIVGHFLTELHSIEFKHNNLVEYPYGDNDFWKNLWEPIKKKLSNETFDKSFKYFKDYFKRMENINIKRTICHADFHPNHILYNKEDNKVTGIIDFGRLSINDPAVDFNLIQRFYGDEAIEIILNNYYLNKDKHFKQRIKFQNIRRQFAAIFHAKIVGNESEITRYLERIENINW